MGELAKTKECSCVITPSCVGIEKEEDIVFQIPSTFMVKSYMKSVEVREVLHIGGDLQVCLVTV